MSNNISTMCIQRTKTKKLDEKDMLIGNAKNCIQYPRQHMVIIYYNIRKGVKNNDICN